MSSSSRTTTTALTVAGLTIAGSILAYAAYFDYKRRNNVEFRKKLRKEKKRVNKALAESRESEGASGTKEVTPEILREALEQVKNEESPKTPSEKEAYFMQHVGIGEKLAAQGPDFHLPAALSFFRALRVYPSPVDLIMIYQKTVPEPVFRIIMELTNLNVSDVPSTNPGNSELSEDVDEETSPTRGGPPSDTSSQEWDRITDPGYYDYFPPKWTKVSIEQKSDPVSHDTRSILVLTEDVKAGDTIYKEYPIVTTLDADLEAAGTYCSHCLRQLDPSSIVMPPEKQNPLGSSFCSQDCFTKAKKQSHTLLFTLDTPLPPEIPAGPIPESALESRKQAQVGFVEYIKKDRRAAPLLVAKFIARQIAIETNKMVQSATSAVGGSSFVAQNQDGPASDFTDAEGGEYLLADHIERLKYLEMSPDKEQGKIMAKVLEAALPGLEQFITEERHATLLGKMSYNSYGVYFDAGRDDKPKPTQRPEDVEKSRTPIGTQRQIGSAMYTVSSYLTHSCVPNARVTFPEGTARLHLVAERDLKKGDQLYIAYVDVRLHENDTIIACRRERRMELVRGWRFACSCERCEEEAKLIASWAAGATSAGSEDAETEAVSANVEEHASASNEKGNEPEHQKVGEEIIGHETKGES